MDEQQSPGNDDNGLQLDEQNAGGDETKLVVSRRLYTHDAFNRRYSMESGRQRSLKTNVKEACACTKRTPWNILTTYLPVIKFVQKYQPRQYALGDFLSGLTVSFMHLPQAMGFGILANLRPEHGLYATFFPVLIYIFFGTSPHISFGTNAVMALLTQTVVNRESDLFAEAYMGMAGNNGTAPTYDQLLAVRTNAAAACCLLTGIFLTGMGVLRCGFLTTYMSDSFVGGFTTAAAVHIASSQVPKIFGIKVKSFSGAGKLVLMYIDLFKKIGRTVGAEVIIAVISAAALLFVKICVNERYAKKMKMPIPIDLVVVVIGTFISHFGKFKDNFSVNTVGEIPTSFATPFVPNLDNASNYISDAFVMAILSLAMSISMAKLTAKIHSIQINDNQELIAYGAANLVSGFFSCFPAATAPPRTMILSSLGARTTLNGIPTAVFMLLIILVIGQLFVSLPLSVLAAMIIVSMKELLLQYRNLPNIWRVNKYDFAIWVTTNAVGVLVDLNYGIMAGIGVSILLVVVQTQCTSGSVLVRSRVEDLIVDKTRCRLTDQPGGLRIFKFKTGLYFATKDKFKSQLYEKVANPQAVKKAQRKNKDANGAITNGSTVNPEVTIVIDEHKSRNPETTELNTLAVDDTIVRAVILDCTAVNYMDIGGKNMLLHVIKEYKEIDVEILLAAVQEQAMTLLEASDFFNLFPRDKVFLAVDDAIEHVIKKDNAVHPSANIKM